jgi:hypothetical protein
MPNEWRRHGVAGVDPKLETKEESHPGRLSLLSAFESKQCSMRYDLINVNIIGRV